MPQSEEGSRVVLKNASGFHYIRVCLVLQNQQTRLSAVELKQLIFTGLRSLYGEVGAAFPFDLLTFDEDTQTAVLRVLSRGLVRLWSSLTLLGSFQKEACAFRVLQQVALFAALTGDANPLHLDAAYAAATAFRRPLVPGVLLSGLVGALLAARRPGCVFLRQNLRFPAPLHVGQEVVATVTVRRVKMAVAFVAVSCTSRDRVVMEGEVVVKVPEEEER